MDRIDVKLPFSAALEKELSDNLLLRKFRSGESILREGTYVGSAIMLVSGVVKVYRIDDDGNRHFLYFLREGELCVLSTLCCMRIRKTEMRAVAYTDCDVAFIPSPLPEALMMKYPEWNSYVLKNFNSRMEELMEAFDSAVFNHLDERLFAYLKQHYKVSGEFLRLSHQQIAADLATSREVVSRLMKRFEEEGKVEQHRAYIRILPFG